jgi:hypothetical protein
MLHVLREQSIQRAVLAYPDAGHIPQRNMESARREGLARMQALLGACRKPGNR